MMQMSEIAQRIGGDLTGGDSAFETVCTDTRFLTHGDLFVALRGEQFDAHQFLQQAQDAGACGLVVEQKASGLDIPQLQVTDCVQALGVIAQMRREQFTGCVAAITGSSGKTTVKGMLRDVLAGSGEVLATRGNFNNQIGVPLTLLQLRTQQYAVVELGTNAPGEIGYLTGLTLPQVSLVNNVMPAHYAGFGSIEAIAREKGAIYSRLDDNGFAVINLDDNFAGVFIEATEKQKRIGFSNKSDQQEDRFPALTAQGVALDSLGRATFELAWQGSRQPTQLNVIGHHNVNNALAAAACALAMGLSLDAIARGLAAYQGERSRMQLRNGLRGAAIIDDSYNANPGSVRAAIDYLSSRDGATYLLLGDLAELGSLTEQAHRELGEYAAAKGISALWSLGSKAALSAAAFGPAGRSFSSLQEMTNAMKSEMSDRSTILIKGSRSAHMDRLVPALCVPEEQH